MDDDAPLIDDPQQPITPRWPWLAVVGAVAFLVGVIFWNVVGRH